MYLQFALKKIHIIKAYDEQLSALIANGEIELFQTWQISLLERLGQTPKNDDYRFARQGFSVKGAHKGSGSRFPTKKNKNGEPRIFDKIFDPVIRFTLPELEEGERCTYRLDIHFWESDKSKITNKIRNVFSDSTLKLLMQSWKVNGEDFNKAQEALLDYLEESNPLTAIMENIEKMYLSNIPWIAGVNVTEGLSKLFNWMKESNVNDYFSTNHFELGLKKVDGQLLWRFNSSELEKISPYIKGEGSQMLEKLKITDAARRNDFDIEYQCRVLD